MPIRFIRHLLGPRPPSTLADARFDFADALADIRAPQAGAAVARIGSIASLHELWELRPEIFSLVSQQHDQAEAGRRLSTLDRHRPSTNRATAFVAPRHTAHVTR